MVPSGLFIFVALLGGISAHGSGERIRVPLGRRLADVVADDRRSHRLADSVARRFEIEADDDSPDGANLVVEEVKAACDEARCPDAPSPWRITSSSSSTGSDDGASTQNQPRR